MLRVSEEHERANAVAAVRHYRATDPDGWSAYVADAEYSQADAPVADNWSDTR